MKELEILPNVIDATNFKYIVVDNTYVASILIYDYPNKADIFEIVESIPKDKEYDIALYIKKQNTEKTLKELTYYISNSASEIKTSNKNQIDIDILDKLKTDAKELRRQIQINNEELFHLSIIITFYSNSSTELLTNIKSFQSKIYSKNLISNITNFRHLDSYITTLPLCNFENKLVKNKYRNITTSSLKNIFPFYNKSIFDINGILLGYSQNDNKICNVDFFDNKYLNSNICIIGSTGSGKSFFTKLIIQRLFLIGKYQYIFDPEGEYTKLTNHLFGVVIDGINEKFCFNLLQINIEELYEYGDDFLNIKITKLIGLLKSIFEISKKEEECLKEALKKTYFDFEITDNKESLYVKSTDIKILVNKIFKKNNEFPCFMNVIENIKVKSLKQKIEEFTIKYKAIASKTNIDMTNKLICFDISKMSSPLNCSLVEYFLKYVDMKIKYNIKNSLIYIDEIWKFIKQKGSDNTAAIIYDLFKTIRKKNAGIIAITQDISDFFNFEFGDYGKSILNNSAFKLFFKMDYSDNEILNKIGVLNEKVKQNISSLDKGQAVFCINNNNIKIVIKANDFEEKLIKEE